MPSSSSQRRRGGALASALTLITLLSHRGMPALSDPAPALSDTVPALSDPACPLPDLKDEQMRDFLGQASSASNRSVYVSIFNNDNVNNPSCALGLPGQSMVITRLDETENPGVCTLSPALGLFGTQIYYSLQLTADGSSIASIKMGCEADCGRCYGMKEGVMYDTCMSIGGYITGVYSISFTSPSRPCFGPHSLASTDGITAFQFLQMNMSDLDPGRDTQHPGRDTENPGRDAENTHTESPARVQSCGNSCLSAMVVALTLGVPNGTCHPSAIFGNTLFTFSFTDSPKPPSPTPLPPITIAQSVFSPQAYSLCISNSTECSNSSQTGSCESVFSALPLGECRDDSVAIFPTHAQTRSHVRLVQTSILHTCPRGPSPDTPSAPLPVYAIAAGSAAVACVLVALTVVWVAKTRRRTHYAIIN